MKCTGTLKVTTPTDREIVISRVFDAPRTLVWDAMTRPELLRRWLSGPPGWSMVVCDNDLRVSGAFRCVWCGPDGTDMTMRGVYREVVPRERIVRTESFEHGCNPSAGEQVGTLVLNEQRGGGGGGGEGGKTTLALTLLYSSKAARDGAIDSGMVRGMAAGYDRLAEMLATLPAMRGSRNAA